MKVIENKTSSSETSATIDLEKKSLSQQAKNEVGEFLIEQILSSVGGGKSPVTGDSFAKLSKEYKSDKVDKGGSSSPDLELTGNMLDALDFRVTNEGLTIGVFGKDAPKADGHNNLSGDSQLPQRRFIPAEGEGFTSRIEKEIQRILADDVAEQQRPPSGSLNKVTSKTELYNVLKDVFGELSRNELKLTVLRSDEWSTQLSQLGLLRFL